MLLLSARASREIVNAVGVNTAVLKRLEGEVGDVKEALKDLKDEVGDVKESPEAASRARPTARRMHDGGVRLDA